MAEKKISKAWPNKKLVIKTWPFRQKIAFLNIYQNKVNRGAETYVAELSGRLSKMFKVDIISDVNYLKLLRSRYDVIIPTNGRAQVFLTKIVCLLSGAKMVVSGQSGLGADDKWNLLCFPDVFIALTKPQRDWANRFNKFIRTVIIPNGVDIKKFSFQNTAIEIDLAKPVVLSVGALEESKRLDLLIKAVAKTGASLLLVGKGSQEKKLFKLGNSLLSNRFKIMNFSHSQMPRVYPAADLFVYPTVPWESFGIAMLEAMSCNIAVVAVDDPIRREIVGDAGEFADPTDTQKFADTITKALDSNWENKPRIQAEKYSWVKIAKQYEQLLLEL